MQGRRVLSAVTLLLLCLAGPAFAQVTGSISGVVFDANAQPVEGAVVKISGDALPGGRTVTTAASGQYAFTLLQPGVYTIEVAKQGVGDSKRQAIVEVDKNSTIDLVLGLAIKENIEVSAALPVIDLRSTEVDTNFKRSTIETLPLERSYSGLFQLIPGVAENRSSVGPAAGGTRQDNTYLIDGVNITNPGFGTLATEVNELDIAEVNVKRAGVSAEFGRVAGVVTNAVSKSGSNRFSGTARLDWQPDALIGEFKDNAFRDTLVRPSVSPAIGVGGPIIRDRIFWYGSARYFRNILGDRTNKLLTPLPDQTTRGHELYGKVTAAPTTAQIINVSYRERPSKTDDAGLGSGTSASVGTNDDTGSRVATASWAYFLGNRTSFEAKYLYMKQKGESTPLTDLGYLPTFNPSNLPSMGYFQSQALQNVFVGGYQYRADVNYRSHEVKGTFTRFLDLGNSNHQVKAGGGFNFGEEFFSRTTNGWGIIIQTTTSGVPAYRARYYPEQPAQRGQGRTWSLFLQDDITIASRLTINAGVLVNRDDFSEVVAGSAGCPAVTLKGGVAVYASKGDRCSFLRFGLGDEIQPRLGFALTLRKDPGDKVYANWGRYYAMDQKSSGRSLAPRRVYQRQAFFRMDTGALISDAPLASTTGKLIDPDLQPTYNDEILVGYATPIAGEWAVDAFFMYRKTHNFIDDVPSVFPSTGPYAAANLPCDRWQACQGAEAKRSYKGFTAELTRRLARGWSANVSYTWSRFEGNYDLDYAGEAVFNTSSIIQDGPGVFVQDPYRYGPLRQDRPHVFKVFASWVPMNSLTLGAYLRAQSGTPWNARAADTQGSSNLNYLEAAGTHRNPAWANFDLLASYGIALQGRTSLKLEARVLNVFGNQTALSTDSVQYNDLNTTSSAPYILPYKVPNTFFGTPNSYAPPRRLVLGARFDF